MAHQTLNEELLDAMARHAIGLQRFGSGVRNRIWALLDATEADMRRHILASTSAGLESRSQIRALDRLLKQLRETRHLAWVEARKVWRAEFTALGPAEATFLNGIIVTTFNGVELGTVLPDAARLRNIATTDPFMGKTLAQWSRNIELVDIARIQDQITIGLTQGESPSQIASRITGTVAQRGRNGVTQITRRGAEAITRTVTSGVAAESRKLYALANKDLAPTEIFTATLDGRTTEICRKWDGTLHSLETGLSIEGVTEGETTPTLPLHFGERSVFSPIIDGEVIGDRPTRNFSQRQLVREFGKQQGTTFPKPRGQTARAARESIPRGLRGQFDAFARKRKRQLTGTTPARTTYNQFLRRQSAAVQDDILGASRGALFRRGGLTLDKFVDKTGRTLTLNELALRNRAAFTRAGLDPKDFGA